MKNKKGFALIESIFMIVFISVALLIVYKAFATSFQDENRRVNYDNTSSLYKTYFVKQYFEENDILDYLSTATLTDGYIEIDCDTLNSVNGEYCDFLITNSNFNIKKIYITKYDMDGVTYTNLEPTTIDYFRTLSGTDTTSYRITIWFNDNEYASLKLGDPFYNLNVVLDGGTWNGETPQRIVSGDTVNILDPSKDGYIFAGWNVIGIGSTINSGTFTMGAEDTVLVAVWQRPTYNFVYNGSFQTFTAPLSGYYLVELWGAEGGSYNPSLGQQKGAYISGYINLNKDASISVYIGGAGTTNGSGAAIPGGYNGGGTALGYSDSNNGSGGGATDIRMDSSLNSRIMVAAGGGGTVGPEVSTGNYGGTLLASNAVWTSGSTYTATGGTQISAGGGTVSGAFGQGANGGTTYRAGGGGGYYGGGVHTYTGAGGSSFISGYAGVNAITSSSSTTATNNTIHYSNKYFINGVMTAGLNSGNGKATITYAGETGPEKINSNLNNVRYIKDCINGSSANTADHWVELQAIYNGTNVAKGKTVTGTVAEHSAPYAYTKIVDGDITSANYSQAISVGLQCITVDLTQSYNLNEIAVWHYYADGRTYNNNTTYVSSDNNTWTTVIANTNAETSQGKRVNAYGF